MKKNKKPKKGEMRIGDICRCKGGCIVKLFKKERMIPEYPPYISWRVKILKPDIHSFCYEFNNNANCPQGIIVDYLFPIRDTTELLSIL